MGLLFGVLKNVRKLMVPWLVFDTVQQVACFATLTYCFITESVLQSEPCLLRTAIEPFIPVLMMYCTFDLLTWFMVSFFGILNF